MQQQQPQQKNKRKKNVNIIDNKIASVISMSFVRLHQKTKTESNKKSRKKSMPSDKWPIKYTYKIELQKQSSNEKMEQL